MKKKVKNIEKVMRKKRRIFRFKDLWLNKIEITIRQWKKNIKGDLVERIINHYLVILTRILYKIVKK